MSLFVEVSGFGLCRYPPEMASETHNCLVVCVQQENFEAWTVYRRYAEFSLLSEQLRSLYPELDAVPIFDEGNLSFENLELCRSSMNKWLQGVTSDALILRTSSMYQFLCVGANMPPPYLEIHWRSSMNGSFDEMEMEEMFDGMAEDGGDVDEAWVPDDDDVNDAQRQDMGVWKMVDGGQVPIRGSVGGSSARTKRPGGKRSASQAGSAHDGLDIQSLSVVEAEFMYDRTEYTEQTTQQMATSLATGVSLGRSVPALAQVPMSCPDDPVSTSSTVAKKMINLDTFHIIKVIGKGSFGKVFLVRHKANGTLHALKVLKKEFIIRKNQVEHTKTERSVLGYVHHPFIVGLAMAFQTSDKLFFVLDYCSGGELFFHLGKTGRFPEDRAKFYAAQITLALEYIHNLGVIYRDLKPENVLLDEKGNVRLTDFGLSKESVFGPSSGATSFCGTPEYIAPEVLKRQGHGRAVDWWSLGALLFEMITGLPPFYSRNRETMFDKIMKAELQFPAFMSEDAKDLLSKLLQREPNERLGSGERDAMAVKEHPFFRDMDWESLVAGRIVPPWCPAVAGSLDTSQFDEEFTSMMPTVSPDVRGAYFGSLDRAFEGFSYVDSSLLGAHGGSVAASFKNSGIAQSLGRGKTR